MSDTDALISTPTIEINGEEKEIPRLGIAATFKAANIIFGIIKKAPNVIGVEQLKKMQQGEIDKEKALTYIIELISYAEEDVMKFIAYIMQEDIETIQNPEKYPMGSGVQIIYKLITEHPDFKAFVGQLGKLMKNSPEVKEAFEEVST